MDASHAALRGSICGNSASQPKLIPRMRNALRVRRYSLKTEKAYIHWVKRYLRFHNMRHPQEMGAHEVTAFLNHLASDRMVAGATQNQALAAMLFLYRHVLGVELPWLDDLVRAKTAKRLPTVLTVAEVQAILAQLSGTRWLLVSLLYGAGLRLNECLSLRVKDIDLSSSRLLIRQGKGNKDRVTLLPHSLRPALSAHLAQVKALHAAELARGYGERCLCRWRWRGSTPERAINGRGSSYSRRRTTAATPTPDAGCAITSMRRPCSGPSRRRHGGPGSPSRSAAIPSGTPLPRTFWKPDTTSAWYRS